MNEYKRWLPIIIFSIFLFMIYKINRFYKTEYFDYSPFSLSGSGIQIKFNQDECIDDLSWISSDNNYTCEKITSEGPGCYFSDVNGFTGFDKCPRSCGNCQDQLFPGDSLNNTMLSAPDALYDNESGEMLGEINQGSMNIGNSTMGTFSDKRLYEIEEKFKERLDSMEENISTLLEGVYDDILLSVAENRGEDIICLRNQKEIVPDNLVDDDLTTAEITAERASIPTDCNTDDPPKAEPEFGPRLCPNVSDECYSCLPPSFGAESTADVLGVCPRPNDNVIRSDCINNEIFNQFSILPNNTFSLTTRFSETNNQQEYQNQTDNMCSIRKCFERSNTEKFNLYKWSPVNNTDDDDDDDSTSNLGMMLDINIKNVNCYDLKNLSNYVGNTLNEDICSRVIYTRSINQSDGKVNWKPLYERCPIRCNNLCKQLLVSEEETLLEELNPLDDHIIYVDSSGNDITSNTVDQIHLDRFVKRDPDSENTEYIYPDVPADSDSMNNFDYLSNVENENDKNLANRIKYLLSLIK